MNWSPATITRPRSMTSSGASKVSTFERRVVSDHVKIGRAQNPLLARIRYSYSPRFIPQGSLGWPAPARPAKERGQPISNDRAGNYSPGEGYDGAGFPHLPGVERTRAIHPTNFAMYPRRLSASVLFEPKSTLIPQTTLSSRARGIDFSPKFATLLRLTAEVGFSLVDLARRKLALATDSPARRSGCAEYAAVGCADRRYAVEEPEQSSAPPGQIETLPPWGGA